MSSPVRLGVSPTATTPTDFYSQRFWGFISFCWKPGLCSLSHSPVVPPSLSTCECGTIWSASHRLACQVCLFATCPLCPSCPCLCFLPVWMNVSSLIHWLLDFHTVQFYGSSDCFLFLNLLLFFFWVWKEAKHIYLWLHLGWNSRFSFSWIYISFHWSN